MFLTELLLFGLFFFVLPILNGVYFHERFFSSFFSASQTALSCILIFPAINVLTLLLSYHFLPPLENDNYLLILFAVNVSVPMVALVTQRLPTQKFVLELVNDFCSGFLYKIIIVSSMLGGLVVLIKIRPMNSDILAYFEIGKVFFKSKSLFYPVTPFFPENLFSSHAVHPPFFSLLQTFGYLIQGTSDYYRVNALIYGFYLSMLVWVVLSILRKHYFIGFILLALSFLVSRFADNSILYPTGLDTFRLTYFMFSFLVLRYLLDNKDSLPLLILYSLSLALCLSTHSSGLLFYILMIPIFLSVYTADSLNKKYSIFCGVFISAFLIGGWQYILNYYHFGKLVSDDLLLRSVFNYWDYLRYEREIYNIHEMFGRFFEQFQIPSVGYGFFYPLFLLLCLFCIKDIYHVFKQALLNLFSKKQKKLPEYAPFLLFVLGFWAVILLSICLGQELIIKNRRYILTVYPSLIICVFYLSRIFIRSIQQINFNFSPLASLLKKELVKKISLVVFIAFLCGSVFHLSRMITFYKFIVAGGYKNHRLHTKEFLNIEKEKSLAGLLPGIKEVITYLNKNLQGNDTLLAFARGQIYSHLLGKKIAFFTGDANVSLFMHQTKSALFKDLKSRGIKYVYASYYKPFIFNKSAFSALLSDPRYSTLVMNEGAFVLFRLNDRVKPVQFQKELIHQEKISIEKKQEHIFKVVLEPNQEYLLSIRGLDNKPLSSDRAFYSIKSIKYLNNIASALAFFTYDDATKLWFSTETKKIVATAAPSVSVTVESKDKPVHFNFEIYKIKQKKDV